MGTEINVRQINPSEFYCVACDSAFAEYEIGCGGALKVFWACGETDGEITLCRSCMEKLRAAIKNVCDE